MTVGVGGERFLPRSDLLELATKNDRGGGGGAALFKKSNTTVLSLR